MTETDIECVHTKTTLHGVALTKFLTFFKSRKIIIFSNLNSTNFNDNFKDNFMRKKVNQMASKTKLEIFGRLSVVQNEFMMT